MKKIKLILFDLDGTALQDDRKTFSCRLLNALELAHRTGIHLVPITGRPFYCLPDVLKSNLIWRDIAVVNNGSEIRNLSNGGILSKKFLPLELAAQIIDLADQYSVPIEINTHDKIVLTKRAHERLVSYGYVLLNHHLEHDINHYSEYTDDLKSYASDNRQALLKLTMPYVIPEAREELFAKIKQLPVSCVWGSAVGMEITNLSATKGNSLLWVCDHYGISKEECMAFGDSGNDVSMLRLAGVGVAMGNAPEPVKQAADRIADSNGNDGVAKMIEEMILQRS